MQFQRNSSEFPLRMLLTFTSTWFTVSGPLTASQLHPTRLTITLRAIQPKPAMILVSLILESVLSPLPRASRVRKQGYHTLIRRKLNWLLVAVKVLSPVVTASMTQALEWLGITVSGLSGGSGDGDLQECLCCWWVDMHGSIMITCVATLLHRLPTN